MVTAPPPAPAKAVTPVPPPVTARSTKQPDATPIQSETSKNVVPSAPDETVVPVTKTAFSLRLTPIEVPKNDCPETPESQPGAFPHPELPPAAEVADDFMASIANVSAPVVAGAPNAKPPTPKETASKSPPASPEVPALGTLRPAPEPAQNTVSAVTAVAAVPSTGDRTNPFARTFEPMTPAIAVPPSPTGAEHLPQTAADALRASEPAPPTETAPPPVSAQAIAVRVALPDVPPVDVHVMERAGQVQVAVRTPGRRFTVLPASGLGNAGQFTRTIRFPHGSVYAPR